MLRPAGAVRARVRRAAVRHPGRAGRATSTYRYPGRCRRVDPPGRGPAAGAGGGGGRHRDAEGPAARRGPRRARRWRRPAAFPSWCRAPSTPRSGWPPEWRWPPRCPSFPTPAAWARCRCWPGTSRPPAGARGRGAAGPPPGRRPRPARPLGGRPGPWRERAAAAARYLPDPPLDGSGDPGRRESVHRVRDLVHRRAGPVRAARGGAGAGLAQHAAGHGLLRGRAPRPGPAARPDRRAVRVVHRARAWPRPAAGRWRCCAPRARRRPTSTRP